LSGDGRGGGINQKLKRDGEKHMRNRIKKEKEDPWQR
jgi:hypothetical protein